MKSQLLALVTVVATALLTWTPVAHAGQQIVCMTAENSKPFYTFLIETNERRRPKIEAEARLIVEESDSYISTRSKEVLVADYRQTNEAYLLNRSVEITWSEAEVMLEAPADRNMTGTISVARIVHGTSIEANQTFNVRCSSAQLKPL